VTATKTPRPQDVSDEDLMRRIQADDRSAFAALFDRYSAQALGLARVMCVTGGDAEEVLQDGFLAIWASRGSYDPARGSARTWLLTVIHHRGIDHVRRHRRRDRRRASEEHLDRLCAPDFIAERAEQFNEADQLRAVLRALGPAQLEVITLAYFGGLTHTEIAARLKLPVGTVKGRMRLGLQKVRAGISPSVGSRSPECETVP
jgi:RNA polymerase sigma-70 factor (ECF subfamily)